MDILTYRPIQFGKAINKELLDFIYDSKGFLIRSVGIERMLSYGKPVGNEVFDTCYWIGRYWQACESMGYPVTLVSRTDEKRDICRSVRANDSLIRESLIKRFAQKDFKNGKGTKDDKDFFYGFKADVWSAFAIGVTLLDRSDVND